MKLIGTNDQIQLDEIFERFILSNTSFFLTKKFFKKILDNLLGGKEVFFRFREEKIFDFFRNNLFLHQLKFDEEENEALSKVYQGELNLTLEELGLLRVLIFPMIKAIRRGKVNESTFNTAELIKIKFELNILSKLKEYFKEDGNLDLSRFPKISKLEKKIFILEKQIEKNANLLKNRWQKFLLEEIYSIRNNRVVFLVKKDSVKNVDGRKVGQTLRGFWIEPAVLEPFYEQLEEARGELENLLNKIRIELLNLLKEEKSGIRKIIKYYLAFEIYSVLAILMEKYGFDLLKVGEKVSLANLKHPLIKRCVPNDIKIDKQGLIISGPNMGGKTVLLKQIALAFIFGNLGIPFSAKGKVKKVKNICLDIGDYQQVGKVSSFGAHIKFLNEFSKQREAAIFVDEIGSSTEPAEGAALSEGYINYWLNIKNFVVVTTHFDTLKLYPVKDNRMIVGSFALDRDFNSNYKFVLNTPGASWGIKVAQRLNAPSYVINYAQKLIDTTLRRINSMLDEIYKMKKSFDKRLDWVKQEEKRLREEREKLEKEKENLREKYNKKIDELMRQYLQLKEELKKEIKKQEVNNLKKIQSKIDKDLGNLKGSREKIEKNQKQELREGMYVKWKSLEGEILKIKKNKVLIDAGFKLEVPIDEVEIIEKKELQNSFEVEVEKKKVTYEIDLRGLDQISAQEELLAYLDAAYLNGFNEVRVIHGKGTGVLKKMVWQILKDIKYVESYRLGTIKEGDWGVTIVKLKD